MQTLKTIATALVAFFIFSLFFGCNNPPPNVDFNEGYIEYDILYDKTIPFKYDPNLRPNKLTVKFKDRNSINKIEGLSGKFSFSFIQNFETQTNYTLIKIFSKKLFYQEPINPNAYPQAYADMPKLNISITDETEKILGLNCIKAIASSNDSLFEPFTIFYTNELGIQNPNVNSPFEDIDGVMLSFSVTLFNQKMSIRASNIKHARISDDEFTLPKDYEEVDYNTLLDLLELLQ
jgi:hypothetical protein